MAAAVAGAFWQVGRNNFVTLDDDMYVTDNTYIRDGLTWGSLVWTFTARYAANWHPLTWISHMLDVQLFGMNPAGHHLVSLLFHIANTVLLFLVLFRMTKGLWQSAFVAALFGLHPLHVESVAWVSERKDVLSTFFWILTMGAYIRYIDKKRSGRYVALLVSFALGLMSKPMLVTLPFALLLLDYWPLGRFAQRVESQASAAVNGEQRKKQRDKPGRPPGAPESQSAEGFAVQPFSLKPIAPLIREKAPLFAMSALSCLITYIAQHKAVVASAQPFGVRIANVFVSYFAYIGATLWPSALAVLYPLSGSVQLLETVPAALFFAAATASVFRAGRKWPYLPTGWFWYAGTLVPVIGIIQVGKQARADRYTYIPLIGLFIIAAWGVPELLKTWRYSKQALAASAAVVLSCLFAATWVQVGYWRNSITLFDHTLAVTSRNGAILNNRGIVHLAYGRNASAMSDFNRAIEVDGRDADAYNNRGIVYRRLGAYKQAIADFDEALRIVPGYANAYYNRGLAYSGLGDYPRALKDYDSVIAIDPGCVDCYVGRAFAHNALREYRLAISDCDKALSINPRLPNALWARGIAYDMGMTDFTKAIADFDRALSLNPPEAAEIYRSRGATWGAAGDSARAIDDFTRAIEINPQYAQAYYNRGMTYNLMGNRSRATDDLTEAARLGSEPAREFLRPQGQSR